MSTISAGLLITLIGMGLVFAALVLLWGLMYLMVRLANHFFPDREEEGAGEDIDTGEDVSPLEPQIGSDTELRKQAAATAVAVGLSLNASTDAAAAAAVAVALSLKSRGGALDAFSQTTSTSSWQAIHRANRLTQRLNLFSRKSGRN